MVIGRKEGPRTRQSTLKCGTISVPPVGGFASCIVVFLTTIVLLLRLKMAHGRKLFSQKAPLVLLTKSASFFFAADADERINLQHILKLMIYGRSKQHLCLFSYSSLVPPCNILNFYLWCLLKQNHVRNISTFTAHGERAECKNVYLWGFYANVRWFFIKEQ